MTCCTVIVDSLKKLYGEFHIDEKLISDLFATTNSNNNYIRKSDFFENYFETRHLTLNIPEMSSVQWPIDGSFYMPEDYFILIPRVIWGAVNKKCMRCSESLRNSISVPCCISEQVLCDCSFTTNPDTQKLEIECLNFSQECCGKKWEIMKIGDKETQNNIRKCQDNRRITLKDSKKNTTFIMKDKSFCATG